MNVLNFERTGDTATGCTVRERAPATRISLRVGASERDVVAAAAGVPLPERIGSRAVSGGRSALCLGPDEWVLVTDEADSGPLSTALDEAAARVPMSAVEVSDREITLALEGPDVLDLLATGCPLDLSGMPVGGGTRTVFDTVQVVLTRETDDRFDLTIWRSFSPHVRALLDRALKELAAGL